MAMNCDHLAKVIHLDGRLQEFSHPMTARHVIDQNPNCFLCSSEAMDINSRAPHVPMDEDLQLGQIYFLMPLSKSHKQLSLQDLGALAIKASTTLNGNIAQMERTSTEITESPFSNDNIIVHWNEFANGKESNSVIDKFGP
ncbi:hypothetical protein LguiA_027473 [Lonicera macranthoides]